MRIALYFGSFNPPHVGHLVLANYVREMCGFDEVWMVVSPRNPFKKDHQLMDDALRLEMVRRSVAGCPFLRASDVEFSLPRPSYTAHTLRTLLGLYPGHAFTLLMGGDNWRGFSGWRESASILEMVDLLVYPRPGYEVDGSAFPPGVRLLDQAPLLDISSTMIRKALSEGKDIRYFVPPAVWTLLESSPERAAGLP